MIENIQDEIKKEMKNEVKNLVDDILDSVMYKHGYSRNSCKREYSRVHHIMKRDSEVIIPSHFEMYTFIKKDGWRIIENTENTIILIKEA